MKQYKGELAGVPEEIVEWMLNQQEAQGNKRNIKIFEENVSALKIEGGFNWKRDNYSNELCHCFSGFKNYTPLLNKIKRMERKVIGYKAKNEEFLKACNRIIGFNQSFDMPTTFSEGSMAYKEMEKLNLIDIWFDKVYKEEKPESFDCRMSSEDGGFHLEVSKKGIYYKPEDVWITVDFLRNLIVLLCDKTLEHSKGRYGVKVGKIDVGCKKGTDVEQWKNVLKKYDELNK